MMALSFSIISHLYYLKPSAVFKSTNLYDVTILFNNITCILLKTTAFFYLHICTAARHY